MGQKVVFFFFLLSFIHFYTPCVCNITYARASLNGGFLLFPLHLLGRITLPATIIPHTVLRSFTIPVSKQGHFFLHPPQLLSVITPLSIYYYPVTTFYSFCFHLAAYSKANKERVASFFERASRLGSYYSHVHFIYHRPSIFSPVAPSTAALNA